MSLELLRIHNARNLKEFHLTPHPFFNIIHGSNGAGKTTILESIYLLLRTRTFRTSKYKSFINFDSDSCNVFARFCDSNPDISDGFTLGIARSRDASQPVVHINSKKINSLSIVTNLVILGLITPESFNLLDAGPAIRRKFIDWGVFHVEPQFLSIWRSYKKILNNRNTLLKRLQSKYRSVNHIPSSQLDNLKCWSPQLIELNQKLHILRNTQIENITSFFNDYLGQFSQDLKSRVHLKYYQGWSRDTDFSSYLTDKLNEDLIAGTTRFGSHRGELRIYYDRSLAKDVLSRGQKKILVICLILAQYQYLLSKDHHCQQHMLLLDDIDSELDDTNLYILFKILDKLQSQIFVTTTNPYKFDFINNFKKQLFHVEQ